MVTTEMRLGELLSDAVLLPQRLLCALLPDRTSA